MYGSLIQVLLVLSLMSPKLIGVLLLLLPTGGRRLLQCLIR